MVHVRNSLQNNGTTMHWHGFRQNHTVQQDGVPSIIQCPDAVSTNIVKSLKLLTDCYSLEPHIPIPFERLSTVLAGTTHITLSKPGQAYLARL